MAPHPTLEPRPTTAGNSKRLWYNNGYYYYYYYYNSQRFLAGDSSDVRPVSKELTGGWKMLSSYMRTQLPLLCDLLSSSHQRVPTTHSGSVDVAATKPMVCP